MLKGLRTRIARWVAPEAAARQAVRMYGGARNTRTTGHFGASNTSADAELQSSLATLRSRSRQMVRDSGYAKRAKAILVNNIIGTGVGLQAQVLNTRGELNTRVNDDIERAHREWSRADACHTGGKLHFSDLERALCGEVVEAGEVLVRLHFQRFGASKVPLALEMIEAERIADSVGMPGPTAAGNEVRMGVEVDRYQRPVAYYLRQRHGGDVRFGGGSETVERVPADQIIHLCLTTRWPQTRGEPWFHTAVRKLDDVNEYSQHEISAARASAAYFATIESPEGPDPLTDAEEADGQKVMDIDPLTVQSLLPGEKLAFHTPNRPNSAFSEFMRAMLREIAAGVGTSYESLSRDYSQSNYSSSRLALLDDRDGYRALQQWWVRSFREPLYRMWLQQAVLSRAITAVPIDAYAADRARYEAVLWKLRGWSWVDPTKEVNAYKEAVKAGFTTITDVIAQTAGGMDIEDVITTRKRELQMLAEAGIEVDTTVQDPLAMAAAQAPAAPPEELDDDEEESDAAQRARDAFLLAGRDAERALQVADRAAEAAAKSSTAAAATGAKLDAFAVQVERLAEVTQDVATKQADHAARASVQYQLLQAGMQALRESPAPADERRPLYASRAVINAEAIREWAAANGFTSTLPASDMHVTVAYSRAPITGVLPATQALLIVSGGQRSVEPLGDDGAIVLKFSSPDLQARWRQYIASGASWDHESYTPHVTLTYDGAGVDLSKVKPFDGALWLGIETQEPLNLNKADEYVEEPTTARVYPLRGTA